MSTNVVHAQFRDMVPGAFRKHAIHESVEPLDGSIIADVGDGVQLLEYMLDCAGFKHTAMTFALQIFALVGDSNETLWKFDDETAKHLNCSDKTVGRHRKAYMAEAQATNFYPIRIHESEYVEKQFTKTGYSLNLSFAGALAKGIADARGDAKYSTDRLEALRRAAEDSYEGIDDAPAIKRKRAPRRSAATPLTFTARMKRDAERADDTLRRMPTQQAQNFLDCNLVQMQMDLNATREIIARMEAEIAAKLQGVENAEVEPIGSNLSLPPQDAEIEAQGGPACVPVKKEEEGQPRRKFEPTAEHIAGFDALINGFKRPAVTVTDVPISRARDRLDMGLPEGPPEGAPNEAQTARDLSYEPDLEQLAYERAELAAILEIEQGLSREEAETIAYTPAVEGGGP